MSPSATLGSAPPPLHRAGSDMGYGMTIPGHLRSEIQHSPRSSPALTSQPYMSAVGGAQRSAMTSHPNYPPPPVLEPPTGTHSGQSTNATGSPHMGNVGWQSPSHHQGMPSPAPGENYVYPEPQYGAPQNNLYYPNSNMPRRPQSTEPEHYDPRQASHIWPQTVQ